MSTVSVHLVEWHGPEVTEKVIAGTMRAMDRVMADCVSAAKELAPVRTAALQRSIQMRPTRRDGGALVGQWGSFQIGYAIYQEMGTGLYAPGGGMRYEIRPRRRRALWWDGLDHPVAMVRHPGVRPRPYLRPSADAIYPALPQYIREELKA